MDLKRIVKRVAAQLRQYLRRIDVAERHVRGTGLEIGALQDPLPLPRGVRVRYVDLAPTEELRAMYPAKVRRHLVDVDIVDDAETLDSVADGSQDFVVSNHFLEHCQNPVGALRNMFRVLRPGGVVYASIPDKRYTFDHPRPATTVEHVLRDDREGPGISRREHYEEVARQGGRTPEEARARLEELMGRDFPIHFHCWTQTDFLELLTALQRRGEPRFEVEHFGRNEQEMVVVLRKEG